MTNANFNRELSRISKRCGKKVVGPAPFQALLSLLKKPAKAKR